MRRGEVGERGGGDGVDCYTVDCHSCSYCT